MRRFNEKRDGEMWAATLEWLASVGVTLPKNPPEWVHREGNDNNPTFYHACGLAAYVLGFKRSTDNQWVFTTVRLKRCEDD